MSNRFHNKFHRHNHHTDPTSRDSLYPDSAYDPIASQESPFKGDFYLDGNLIGTKSAIFGENLTINGDSTTLNTRTYITSAVSITNTSSVLPAFTIFHYSSAANIAQFFGTETRSIVFDPKNQIGVGTTSPSAAVHIVKQQDDGDASVIIDSLGYDSKLQLRSFENNAINFCSFDSGNGQPFTYASINSNQRDNVVYVESNNPDSTSLILRGSSNNCSYIQYIGTNSNVGKYLAVSPGTGLLGGFEINSLGAYRYVIGSAQYEAFTITPAGSVGINNVAQPNKTLTVNGEISSNDIIWDKVGNSVQWNSTYTTVSTASANWNSTHTSVRLTSANWDSVYTSVGLASANWNSAYTTISTASANWDSVYTTVSAASGGWNSMYTTVNTNSASWNTTNDRLPLSGGHVQGPLEITWAGGDPSRREEALYVIGNVTIQGDLSSTGTQYFANTLFATTSSICAINLMGSGPALYVGANGTGDIGSFYDIDAGVEVLHIGGRNSTFPHVGVNTSVANKDLTVKGEISASNIIYDGTGNSQQWNSAYTAVSTTSAYWSGTEIRVKSVDSISVGSNSSVTLTNTSLDQEITTISMGVTSISAFFNSLRGNTYTITNKANRPIAIVQSPLIFVRQGHSWRSNASSYTNSFLTLPVSGSCLVRADGADFVSVW